MVQVTVIIAAFLFSIPSPEDVRQAAKRVIANGDFQTELPGDTGYTDWAPPPWERDEDPIPLDEDWDWQERDVDRTDWSGGNRPARTEPRTRGRDADGPSGSSGGPAIGNAILWLLLAVSVGVAAVWIARSLAGYTRDAKVEGQPRAAPPRAPVELTRPKTEAERLAETGQFGAAIHVLLLETLAELGRHLPGGIRKSYTSREIARRVDVADDARPALEALVSAVEASLFGHHVPDRAEYDACVAQFQRFAAAAGARA